MQPVTLRRYEPRDEDAAVALWLRSWQKAYPELDFAERLGWWRARWRNELVPAGDILIAEADSAEELAMIGFDGRSGLRLSGSDRGCAGAFALRRRRDSDRRGAAHFAGRPRSRRQYRQCPRHRILPAARIFHQRLRRKPGLGQAGAPHELAAVTDD